MKHPQSILAVKTKDIITALNLKEGMNTCSLTNFVAAAQNSLVIGQREQLEKDESCLQVLPYLLIVKSSPRKPTRFKAYRRGKGVGESRLSGNVSIGFGGHVDLADVAHEESVIDLKQTVMQAAVREVAEELIFDGQAGSEDDLEIFDIGLIVDTSNEVGRVHLGVVLGVSMPENRDCATAEDELEDMPFLTADELLASGLPLENWTRIALEFFKKMDEGTAA